MGSKGILRRSSGKPERKFILTNKAGRPIMGAAGGQAAGAAK